MKYFTKELWADMNSDDPQKRAYANKMWMAHAKEYQNEFKKVKHYIPHFSLKLFQMYDSFHDYIISEIRFTQEKRVKNCIIRLNRGSESVCITMRDISKVHISIDDFDGCICGNLQWGYCEFSIDKMKRLHLSVLCDIDKELNFVFRKIKMSKK